MSLYDIAIIGSGPGGMTAAIYAKRAGLNVVLIEASAPGGKMIYSHQIDNFPGEPGINGTELAMKFFNHVQKEEVELIFEEVKSIKNIKDDLKELTLISGKNLQAKNIILAFGMTPRRLPLDNIDKFFGKGYGVCVICDAALYKNNSIVVVGNGNSAVEESIYAADLVKKLYIVNKFDYYNAEEVSIKKLLAKPNVVELKNTDVTELIGDSKIEAIKIKNNTTNEGKTLDDVKGIFPYIGYFLNEELIKDLDLEYSNGFIKVDFTSMETSTKGIYAIGDSVDKKFKQITTSISEGTIAALSIKKKI